MDVLKGGDNIVKMHGNTEFFEKNYNLIFEKTKMAIFNLKKKQQKAHFPLQFFY